MDDGLWVVGRNSADDVAKTTSGQVSKCRRPVRIIRVEKGRGVTVCTPQLTRRPAHLVVILVLCWIGGLFEWHLRHHLVQELGRARSECGGSVVRSRHV